MEGKSGELYQFLLLTPEIVWCIAIYIMHTSRVAVMMGSCRRGNLERGKPSILHLADLVASLCIVKYEMTVVTRGKVPVIFNRDCSRNVLIPSDDKGCFELECPSIKVQRKNDARRKCLVVFR